MLESTSMRSSSTKRASSFVEFSLTAQTSITLLVQPKKAQLTVMMSVGTNWYALQSQTKVPEPRPCNPGMAELAVQRRRNNSILASLCAMLELVVKGR